MGGGGGRLGYLSSLCMYVCAYVHVCVVVGR